MTDLTRIAAHVPSWAVEALDAAAEDYGLSRSEMARVAILLWIEGRQGGPSGRAVQAARGPELRAVSDEQATPPRIAGGPSGGPRAEGRPRARASDPDSFSSQKERSLSPEREDPERPSDPAGWTALTAELVRAINASTGGQAREDDPTAQQALVMRLTGIGLAPRDAGPATVAQVRATVADASKRWEPGMVSLQSVTGPKFWTHHGKVGTPIRRPRSDADERAQRFERRKQPGYYGTGVTINGVAAIVPGEDGEGGAIEPI